MDSHSRILLFFFFFPQGRSDRKVSKKVNQPCQAGNPTKSWETGTFFIQWATFRNEKARTWNLWLGKRNIPKYLGVECLLKRGLDQGFSTANPRQSFWGDFIHRETCCWFTKTLPWSMDPFHLRSTAELGLLLHH